MRGFFATPAGRYLLIAALVLLIGVPSLFTRRLWVPDEPRYAEVAREMLVDGNWIVPHCNGVTYAEKPPLFFWLAALGQKAGLGPDAGRVVTILAALCTCAAVFFAFRGPMGAPAAAAACLVMQTTVFGMLFTKTGVIDPLLMCFETIAIVMGYRAFHSAGLRGRLWNWLACYAATGLAILTKGPVALAVVAMVLASYGVLNRKQTAGSGGAIHLAGLAVTALVVGAWLVPAVLKGGPDYARVILFRQQVGRLLNYYGHKHPFVLYYAGLAPGYFFPWSLLWPLALVTAVLGWRCDQRGKGPLLLAAVWNVIPAIFFSLLVSKRMQYLLPGLPAAGLLVAAHMTTAFEPKGRVLRAERGLLAATFGLAAALMTALAIALISTRFPVLERVCRDEYFLSTTRDYATAGRIGGMLAAIVAMFALAVAGLVTRPEKRLLRAGLLAAMMIVLSLVYDFGVAPLNDRIKSPRDICAEITRRDPAGKSTYAYMNNFSVLYNLYTGDTKIPVLSDPAELMRKLHVPGVLVIADARDMADIQPDEWSRSHVALKRRVGKKTMYLLEGTKHRTPRKAAADPVPQPAEGVVPIGASSPRS